MGDVDPRPGAAQFDGLGPVENRVGESGLRAKIIIRSRSSNMPSTGCSVIAAADLLGERWYRRSRDPGVSASRPTGRPGEDRLVPVALTPGETRSQRVIGRSEAPFSAVPSTPSATRVSLRALSESSLQRRSCCSATATSARLLQDVLGLPPR